MGKKIKKKKKKKKEKKEKKKKEKKTHKIEYPLKYVFNITDECIELLIFRGFIETEKFLNDNNNKLPLLLPFSWIDKNLKKKEKKNNKFFYIINLLFYTTALFYNM